MHQLLLLRHAKSSWGDTAVADRDRSLNGRGRRAATAMREAMRDLGLAPDLVLVSPARRTQETLDRLEPWDETPLVEAVETLYLANPPQLLATLHGVAETVRSVLLIGHNPGLHDLSMALGRARAGAVATEGEERLVEGFPTGALAEFAITGPWSRLDASNARLVRFLTPRDLPEAGS